MIPNGDQSPLLVSLAILPLEKTTKNPKFVHIGSLLSNKRGKMKRNELNFDDYFRIHLVLEVMSIESAHLCIHGTIDAT